MLEQAEEGILKTNARLQLAIIDSRDIRDRLNAQVRVYEEQHGRRPRDLVELQRSGLWAGPLADLEGVPFSYDEETGRVSLSRRSPLWRKE